jgi:hypothetical protein
VEHARKLELAGKRHRHPTTHPQALFGTRTVRWRKRGRHAGEIFSQSLDREREDGPLVAEVAIEGAVSEAGLRGYRGRGNCGVRHALGKAFEGLEESTLRFGHRRSSRRRDFIRNRGFRDAEIRPALSALERFGVAVAFDAVAVRASADPLDHFMCDARGTPGWQVVK